MTDKPRVRCDAAGTWLNDGLTNVVANLGTYRDKASHTSYTPDFLDAAELVSAYRTSWLAGAIVDFPAEDACRKWRNWRGKADQITAIEALEKRLKVKSKTKEALTASRLLGGSAIYINTGSPEPDSPLEPGEEIRSLVVLGKDQLTAGQVVRDIESEYFGRPDRYTITTGSDAAARQVEIHASRFCIFNGDKVPGEIGSTYSDNASGWGDSSLLKKMAAIKVADSAVANISSLIYEANVDVMSVQGFADLLSNNQDDLILRRSRLQAAMKGINGMLMIDSEDSYEKKSATFSGLDALLSKFFDWCSGAAEIPVTRLFGRAAAGLSGSGDGDERVYYDRIEDVQTDDIAPAIAKLDELMIAQALGSVPDDVYFEWSPLRQKTESENAEIFAKYATAARSLAGTNGGEIIPMDALSDAMVNALTESGVLPGLEGYVAEYGTLAEQDGFVGGEE